jgi:hypothetical protein
MTLNFERETSRTPLMIMSTSLLFVWAIQGS